MSKFGKVIIGNLRKGANEIPAEYLKIRVDREHPTLGNQYVLEDWRDDDMRTDVLADYLGDYEEDCKNNGPMLEATKVIARKVYKGQSVALMCWCRGKPTYKPCHADFIKSKIEEILKPYE